MRCGSFGANFKSDGRKSHYRGADGALHIFEVLRSYWRHYGRIFEQPSLGTNKQSFTPPKMYLVTSNLMH